MTQNDRKDKHLAENQNSSTVESGETPNDSALVQGLERLAFKLHDLGNRLLSFLK